jgi:hypothetical protein
MKKVLFMLLLAASGAHAEYRGDEPFKEFDATRNMVNKTVIVWRQEANVTQACDAESRRQGNGGFGYNVLGCSFYTVEKNISYCTILTPQRTTLANLGHEVRHCFQGHWHD